MIPRIFLLLLLHLPLWAWAETPTILVYGDSLSAAYGIPRDQGWVELLQKRLAEQGYPHRVANASISGETTSGGLSRLENTLRQTQPDIVVLELGANDGLRGLPLQEMRHNLSRMIETTRKQGAKVLLLGMRIPPNYGPPYTREFAESFHSLSQRYDIPLVEFFLEGVAGQHHLNQPDGIHPTAEGQKIMLDNVWARLTPLLETSPTRASTR